MIKKLVILGVLSLASDLVSCAASGPASRRSNSVSRIKSGSGKTTSTRLTQPFKNNIAISKQPDDTTCAPTNMQAIAKQLGVTDPQTGQPYTIEKLAELANTGKPGSQNEGTRPENIEKAMNEIGSGKMQADSGEYSTKQLLQEAQNGNYPIILANEGEHYYTLVGQDAKGNFLVADPLTGSTHKVSPAEWGEVNENREGNVEAIVVRPAQGDQTDETNGNSIDPLSDAAKDAQYGEQADQTLPGETDAWQSMSDTSSQTGVVDDNRAEMNDNADAWAGSWGDYDGGDSGVD